MATQKKILVIDEDEFITRLYVKHFGAAGYDTEVAGDGESGIERARDLHPDLILLDVVLPGMDGIAVLKELKKDAATASIPVAMLTNLQDQETAAKAFRAGSAEYFVKVEHTIDELVKKVGGMVAQA